MSEEKFEKELKDVIEILAEKAEEEGFDNYWHFNQLITGDYLIKTFFEEYFRETEGFACCADKANYVLGAIKEMIKQKSNVKLQQTYREYQENGGDIGSISELDNIAYWCPKSIATSKDAIELFYKNTIGKWRERLMSKEEMIDTLQSFVDIATIRIESYPDLKNDLIATKLALEYIEQLENKVKEHEEHINDFYKGKMYTAKQLRNIEKSQRQNFIHKQKIRDKIEELNMELAKYREYCKNLIETDVEYYQSVGNEIARDILQELLQEEEE